jgi:hypothetical protein
MPLLLRPLLPLPLLALGILAACSGSTSGGGSGAGTVTGTVSGVGFSFGSGVAIAGANTTTNCEGPTADGGEDCTTTTDGYAAEVILANLSILTCSLVETSFNSSTSYANADALALEILNLSGPVTAGTYNVIAPDAGTSGVTSGASAQFTTTTATCGNGLDLTATSGTITVSAISGSSISGTYDVTFGTAGSFSGSFNTAVCAVPDAGSSSSGDGGINCVQ